MKRSLAIALLAGALVAGGASAAPRTVTDPEAPAHCRPMARSA